MGISMRRCFCAATQRAATRSSRRSSCTASFPGAKPGASLPRHPRAARGFDPGREPGLGQGARRLRSRRGESFNAYAAPTILGELRRHFRDRVWEIRLPRRLHDRAMAVREAAEALSEELGRTPAVSRIAERLELSEEEVLETLCGGFRASHPLP